MTQELEIVAGRYYKTRDGRKAFVVSVDLPNPFGGNSTYTVSVYIEGLSNRITVTDRGRLYINTPDCAADLVAEWREPRTRNVWVAMYENPCGNPSVSFDENKCRLVDWVKHHFKLLALREITITEGEGT
jgi:hypothetical protein